MQHSDQITNMSFVMANGMKSMLSRPRMLSPCRSTKFLLSQVLVFQVSAPLTPTILCSLEDTFDLEDLEILLNQASPATMAA